MKAVGLFAGIGGIEYGLHQNGIDTVIKREFPWSVIVLGCHIDGRTPRSGHSKRWIPVSRY